MEHHRGAGGSPHNSDRTPAIAGEATATRSEGSNGIKQRPQEVPITALRDGDRFTTSSAEGLVYEVDGRPSSDGAGRVDVPTTGGVLTYPSSTVVALVDGGAALSAEVVGGWPWETHPIDEVVRANGSAGGHWFDADTLRFFSCRLQRTARIATVEVGGEVVRVALFVTSERQTIPFLEVVEPRRWTVRLHMWDTSGRYWCDDIGGGFQRFTTRREAVSAASFAELDGAEVAAAVNVTMAGWQR